MAHFKAVKQGVGAVGALLALTGYICGCSSSGSAGGRVTLTLYSGQHPQTTEALVAAFQRQTGIRVKERDGDEDQLAAEIEEEGPATPADVFYSENSPSLMSLQGKGLLARLPTSVVDQVPARFESPRADWVGVSARVSVMVYNTSLLKPSQLPTSITDLAAKRWKGKLALSPTETDLLPTITSLSQALGQAGAVRWLKGVDSNASDHVEPDNETVTADVNNGRAEIGVIDQYYWYRLKAEIGSGGLHSAIAYFAPRDPGYVLDVSGAGVIRSSKHLVAAEELASFLVSATAQQIIAHGNSFEYPVRPGIPAAAGLTPLGDLQPVRITVAQLGDGALAVELEQEAQVI